MTKRSLSAVLRILSLCTIVLGACASPTLPPSADPPPDATTRQRSTAFMPNPGIWDEAVRFRTLGTAGVISFGLHEVLLPLATSGEARVLLDGLRKADMTAAPEPTQLRLRFEGANPAATVVGEDRLAGVVNYFIGSDPARWHTAIPTYESVVYRELYAGVDLVYRSGEGTLKGTYVVAPGANPGQIRWRYEGATDVKLRQGELLLGADPTSASVTLVERRPVAWQTVAERRVAVSVRYVLHRDGSIGFALGRYDPTAPLVIDPTLDYSTYAGNVACQGSYHMALDANDKVYLTGIADTRNPPTGGACAEQKYYDIFVTKLDPALTGANQHIYTTFIGGRDFDLADGIGVDAAGKAYLAGYSWSNNFPTTASALLPTFKGGFSDGVVVQLSPTGAIQYATYLGGSNFEEIFSASVSSAGLVAVTGFTSGADFPTTANAYQRTLHNSDAFVSVLDPTKSGNASLVYSTFFGGTRGDEGYAVELMNGLIYLAGTTNSTDLPLVNPVQNALKGPLNGYGDTYVAIFDPARVGSAQLRFATYLGGSDQMDLPWGVTADGAGNVYMVGLTASTDFPTTAISPAHGGGEWDGFLVKIDPFTPRLVYSRYVGGNGKDGLRDIAVDGQGNAHVAGGSGSTNLVLPRAIQATNKGGAAPEFSFLGEGDALVATFDGTGALIFGTFLGGTGGDIATGLALDTAGNVYVAGGTKSTDLVTVNPYQATNAGGFDSFVARIGGIVATPTAMRTATPTPTPTATRTATPTATQTPTATPLIHRQYLPGIMRR